MGVVDGRRKKAIEQLDFILIPSTDFGSGRTIILFGTCSLSWHRQGQFVDFGHFGNDNNSISSLNSPIRVNLNDQISDNTHAYTGIPQTQMPYR